MSDLHESVNDLHKPQNFGFELQHVTDFQGCVICIVYDNIVI